MPLDTTKSIKSITYNGTEIPLASTAGGDTSETWVLNDLVDCGEFGLEPVSANFISNSQQFIGIASKDIGELFYDQDEDSVSVFSEENSAWIDSAYRKLTFTIAPTGDLLTWLQANGVKQEKNLAIQPSKNLTITSNGTTTITPDAPYDAMGEVDLTVNVTSGGGNTTTALTIKCSDENGYGLPLLITYQTNNGEMRQAYNGETMNTDSGPITFQDVLIGGICIISIPTETTAWIAASLHNIDVNVTNIYMNDAVGSEKLSKALAYKITGVNAEINLRLLAS